MNKAIRFKLFLMMVLEFFIWGAWLPLIFGYLPSLGFSNVQQSLILNAFPIAAIVGMFFSNQFADRNFAGERFLAVSHLIGGISILSLAFVTSFFNSATHFVRIQSFSAQHLDLLLELFEFGIRGSELRIEGLEDRVHLTRGNQRH